jgi:ribosomal protein L24E
MCFPFKRCDLCNSYVGLRTPYLHVRIDQRALYFCSVECRAKHYIRRNRSIPEPRKYDEPRKKSPMATGRYASGRDYHAF